MRIDRQHVATGPLFLEASIDADAVNDESRSVRFLASDETIDRYGDIVRSSWNLAPFKKNPVFLWSHDQHIPAIGNIQPIAVENKKLIVTANFTDEGVNPFADQLYKLVKAKVLRAVSVGFTVDPTDVEMLRDAQDNWTGGYTYNNPELLEISLCNVGANAHALAVARSLGVPPAVIDRAIVPNAFIEQQRRVFTEVIGARVREAKHYRPR